NIAEERKLVGLNGSIEGAGGGEEGKGFAVVAEEVGKLGEESKRGGREINELVDEIENDRESGRCMMCEGGCEGFEGINVIGEAGSC
ncbi:methyl-accepting chemotaxis protein, partial [Bacillus thuringiensis]|uniref:methyl-accepting chemotaxis protein n=1 Tax=Bacillus thuringiensis TaxID=1428 RepID=UPI0021B4F455